MFLIEQTGTEPSWMPIKKMVEWKDKVLQEKIIMEIDSNKQELKQKASTSIYLESHKGFTLGRFKLFK